MPRLALLIALVTFGCSKPAATPTTPKGEEMVGITPVEVNCDYHYYMLPMYSPPSHQRDAPFVHAHEAARAHDAAAEQASTDGKREVAAGEFLACARSYADIKDDDSERSLAMKTADLCIANAILAYQMAGKFAALGKAELDKLAVEEPRLKPAIDARLVKPPMDCPTKP